MLFCLKDYTKEVEVLFLDNKTSLTKLIPILEWTNTHIKKWLLLPWVNVSILVWKIIISEVYGPLNF